MAFFSTFRKRLPVWVIVCFREILLIYECRESGKIKTNTVPKYNMMPFVLRTQCSFCALQVTQKHLEAKCLHEVLQIDNP